ncbi:MAG: hypothetical protein IJX63_14470, partial [Lachnospiraceae bacterium]|nr:hypothetical protein [Lachnospiraceae bacterium]
MKNEKKTIIIWILAIVAIVLAVILAVVVFGKKDAPKPSNTVMNNQSTQESQEKVDVNKQESDGTKESSENTKPEKTTEPSKEVQAEPTA